MHFSEMNEKKKLNLLPPEAKSKYANKYLKITAATIAGFFILLLLIQYGHIGVLTLQTNKILADNQKYNKEKETIQILKENIANYEAFLKDYENVDCLYFLRIPESICCPSMPEQVHPAESHRI